MIGSQDCQSQRLEKRIKKYVPIIFCFYFLKSHLPKDDQLTIFYNRLVPYHTIVSDMYRIHIISWLHTEGQDVYSMFSFDAVTYDSIKA